MEVYTLIRKNVIKIRNKDNNVLEIIIQNFIVFAEYTITAVSGFSNRWISYILKDIVFRTRNETFNPRAYELFNGFKLWP